MPRNVRLFAWLWLAGNLGQIPGMFFLPPPASIGVKSRLAEILICMALLVITEAITIPLYWLIVWRHKNWARWVLFALFVVLLLPCLDYSRQFEPDEIPQTIIIYVSALVQAAAFFFIFTGDGRPWFERAVRLPNASAQSPPHAKG